MQSSIKRWHLDNIEIVRRVIVSVIGVTVLLIGIALLVLPGPAFVVIRQDWRFWRQSTPGHGGGSEKDAELRATLSPVGSGRQFTNVFSSSHHGEREKRAAECAEHEAHKPK